MNYEGLRILNDTLANLLRSNHIIQKRIAFQSLETRVMDRNVIPLFQYQLLITFWALTGLTIGFGLTCTLFMIQHIREMKRPGINLRGL